jgi:glutathione S-transferase
MTAYRLHYFPESGDSYKLALMLTSCAQDFEMVWTDFAGGVTRTGEWRRTVNEMGEIPPLPKEETDYDFAVCHPAVKAWLERIAAIPGWRAI